MTEISFPRQQARTRRFTLGVPRAFTVAPDGRRVIFLRSKGGSDPLTCLYELEVASGAERLLVDPEPLLEAVGEEVPPEELARRERARESATGIVRFHTDRACERAIFELSGRLYTVELASAALRPLACETPAVEARLSPLGRHAAYVSKGALHVIGVEAETVGSEGAAASAGGVLAGDRVLAGGGETGQDGRSPRVTYGLAEFIAAEEMGRSEGFWWSPEGDRILVARVDESRVARRFIADPAWPEVPPVEVAYPAAGTANAEVTLQLMDLVAGAGLEVAWDRDAFEYLTAVSWTPHGLLLAVQSRDQRRMQVLAVDLSSGATSLVREDRDEHWVDIVAGVPARLGDGTLVWTADLEGAKRLVVGTEAVTPEELQVRSVLGVDGDTVLLSGSVEATEIGAWSWSAGAGLVRLPAEPGPSVAAGWCGGGTVVLALRSLEDPGLSVTVQREGREVARIASVAETPAVAPRPLFRRAGARGLRTAVLFPTGHEPGSGKLPVLMDPYGGPHAQMVLAASSAFLGSQWFADQGYCVVVADGRGTPGRGPAWDRAVAGDLASAALEDQVAALEAAAEEFPDLDRSRVAIRGWSFGGYLAALAVLRRPEVFHAAVAGAPVTDWRLYDTHYTERYLGDPNTSPQAYERSSLLGDAPGLRRPLLLVHGLADDNVAAANTLQLSSALLAAGRPHSVLPLSGVTHITAPQEVVAENLLLLQLDFLRKALAAPVELVP